MAPQVLHRVLYGTTTPTPDQTSSLTIQPALLPRYIRHRVRNCDYPAIIPSLGPDACVRGTFVNGISAEDQWRLDLFEGAQYDRLAVKVRLLEGDEVAEGREVEAETYVWCEGGDGLEDGEWDFEEFMKEKMGRWVGNDKEYEGELRPSIVGAWGLE